MFKDDGTVPNNPALPVLIYKGAVDVDSKLDPASAIEKLLATNGGAAANDAMAFILSYIITQ
jgi:uncharacterized protein YjlB